MKLKTHDKQPTLVMLRLVVMLLSLFLSVAISVMPAHAQSGGYPYAGYSGPGTNPPESFWADQSGNGISPDGYNYRNCTDYVAWKLKSLGVADSKVRGLGNGGEWAAIASGRSGVLVSNNPTVGSAAVRLANGSDPYGHVAFVEAVNSNGTITVSEYNWVVNGVPDGAFHRRTATASSMGLTKFVNFGLGGSGSLPQPGGPGTRILGDVNGDGMQDAVVMFRDTGTAMVALSNGSAFNAPQSWSHLHSVNAEKYFLADVNGDGLDDLVAGWLSTGKWYVSLSSGSGFWPASDWATGHGIGTSNQWVRDVNGDGKADMVTFDRNTGDWWSSISSGSGFYSPLRWISGHGYGSNGQQLDDFNGDGKADTAVYFSGQGKWYVSASNGNTFNGFVDWSSGHGMGSNAQYVGDVNGDGKSDAAYFFSANGHWDAGMSEGGGFWAPTGWAHGHGIGTSQQFIGDVNGDGKADMVTFDRNTGDWWVSASSGSGFWSPVRWASGHGANS